MIIGSCKISFTAAWVSSLKEKRMIVKSLLDRAKRRFNISIAEVEDMDVHQSIVIGFACVSNERAHVDSMIDHVLNFLEDHTEAVIRDVEREIL